MKILLVIATLLSFRAAGASEKISVNQAKAYFTQLCGSHVQCQKDVVAIPEDATCQQLRDFMLSHGIRVNSGEDVSEVVNCKN